MSSPRSRRSRGRTSCCGSCVAAALGGAIGLERELRERQAGLRTHLVVCLGSALFTIVSAYGFREFLVHGGSVVRADPTRIAAQIVSGIGFLGAGAIIRQGLSVRGLTTAATLWLVAAIGMASGAGYYSAALFATAAGLLTLGPLRIFAYKLVRRYRPEVDRLLVDIPAGGSPVPVLEVDRAARRPRHLARDRAGGRPALDRRRRRAARRRCAGDRRRRRRHRRRARGALERMKATLCSRNAHKARELEVLLPGWTIEPLDADDYPPETGDSYYENARAKAAFGRTRVPGWTLGEDSGLEVAALGGRPGIESARYAPEGAPAIAKLLGELEGVEDRRARYVSELVALAPDGEELRGTGVVNGRIADEPRGSGGFGYDPVFVPDGEERTVAELGDAWKAQNSHRARSAQALREAVGRRARLRSARRSACHQFSSAPNTITFAIT